MFTQNSNHNINFQPVTKDVTAQDAMQFAHVGRITMKVDRSQGIMGAISEWFNGDVRYDDVASFEIKIIPARGADIKNTFADVMNDLPQEVRSIAISAKENIGDSASDLNIISANTVYDIVTDSRAVATQMENNYLNNTLLRHLGY
ncbi:hypothetical protein ACYJEJ_002778 [Proteus mirabilis]|nr:hypothetical protein [Proteus mirabilis]MDC5908386.1 hypothetical protein [Proteus mirabilis]